MKSDTVISVQNISKKYAIGEKQSYLTLREQLVNLPKKFYNKQKQNEFWALKDVSFEVKKGDLLGIIGRNGAGKSTLLKILSRITEPTSGQITMKGRVASLLEVGTGFNPELTGRENIYLNGSILGMSRREINQKFDEIVSFADIGDFLDTPVKRYSSGMYVRLAFAVSAHLDSDILLVDEVLAVGDIEFQKKCISKMNNLAHGGKTVVFISHSIPAISKLCNRCIWIQKGTVVKSGETQKILDAYVESTQKNLPQTKNNILHSTCGRFKLLDLAWIDKTGKEVSTYKFGENPVLRYKFSFNENTKNIVFGFGIVDQQGQRITTSHHIDDKKNSFPATFYGKVQFDLHTNLINLAPGTYSVIIGVKDNRSQTLLYSDDQIKLIIKPPHETIDGSAGFYWNTGDWQNFQNK